MQISGSYSNYLSMTSLLSSIGVSDSSNYIMQVFSSSVSNLQDKLDQQLFSEETSDALTGLYSQISSLSSLAEKLTAAGSDSIFNDRSAVSSDSSVLTAAAWDAYSQDTGATEAAYEISVLQTAQGQENVSTLLIGSEASVAGTGTNTFNISTEGLSYDLSIDVSFGDTNEDVLNKIANAVNEAGIGITADISAGDDGTVSLSLSADNTGADASFTVSDISGNAVSAAGLDVISSEAQNAVYSIDGVEQTSGSNTVYIDNGAVEISLNGTGDATLEVGTGITDFYDAVTSLIAGVNSFIDFFNSSSDYLTDDIAASLNNIIDDKSSELKSIGITADDSGKLQVDEEQLLSSIENDSAGVKDIFASFDGFAVQVNSLVSNIATDSPLNYAKESDSLSQEYTDLIYDSSATQLKQLLSGSMLDMFV